MDRRRDPHAIAADPDGGGLAFAATVLSTDRRWQSPASSVIKVSARGLDGYGTVGKLPNCPRSLLELVQITNTAQLRRTCFRTQRCCMQHLGLRGRAIEAGRFEGHAMHGSFTFRHDNRQHDIRLYSTSIEPMVFPSQSSGVVPTQTLSADIDPVTPLKVSSRV
jgi:hypothetical protein